MLRALKASVNGFDRAKVIDAVSKAKPVVLITEDYSIEFKGFDKTSKRGDIQYYFGDDEKTEDQIRRIILVNNARIQQKISAEPDEAKKRKALANYNTLLNLIDIEIEDPSSYEAMKKALIEKASAASRSGSTTAYLEAVEDLEELKKRKSTAKKLDELKNKETKIFKDKVIGGVLVQELLDGDKIRVLMRSQGIEEAMTPAFLDVLHGEINNFALKKVKNLAKKANGEAVDAGVDVDQLYDALTDPTPRKPKSTIKVASRIDPAGRFIKRYEPIIGVDPLEDPAAQAAQFEEGAAKKKTAPVASRMVEEAIVKSKVAKAIEEGKVGEALLELGQV